MYKKLTILLFSLLLAIGWTNTAQAQLKADAAPTKKLAKRLVAPALIEKAPVAKQDGKQKGKSEPLLEPKAPNRAPSRTPNTITADVTHVKSWYDAIKYDWVDGNGAIHTGVSITEPATNPYQMAYLLGTTYKNPDIPGIQYSAANQDNVAYENIEFGWDLPGNARWNTSSETTYNDIVISYSTNNYIRIYSIKVMSGNNEITSYCYATDGSILPSGDDWAWTRSGTWNIDGDYFYPNRGASITIPGSLLAGYTNVSLVINCYDSSWRYYAAISINGTSTDIGDSNLTDHTWQISPNNTTSSITPPYENGYTVFLVKVKDGSTSEPEYTSTWNEVVNYFDTHIDEVQLLTDGTRLNEGTDDAGTMFSYSGELNRFYFISKGKMYPLYPYYRSDGYFDGAPTYCMYEEFSGHQPTEGADDITDFYSKLLYGNSYNVIHDCQGVNLLEHYFSMSGKTGTDHKSMTNLIFWIPDNRGVANTRTYNEEYLPHLGLYTITLEATAVPDPNTEHQYIVTCDWVSSLNSILDFSVEQDYEVWEYVYDEKGNPVEKTKVGTTHNTTTLSEPRPQRPDSYTIIYRVYGWPSAATNSRGNGGDFYALSNLDDVLIPGYKNFLSLDAEHYESDFVINEEHNYYRNFLTVDNQNPDNALTAKRILNGEDKYELYRFDATIENPAYTKAADLKFSVDGNNIDYKIDYANQFYIDDADQSGQSKVLTGYKNLDILGCPISGTVATLSDGSGAITPITFDREWDFEDASQCNDWTLIDADGDGYNWYYHSNEGLTENTMITHSGDGIICSESYNNETEIALSPSNWMISPEVPLGGTLKLWACGQDEETYYKEIFGVYVLLGAFDGTNTSGFVQVGGDITTTHEMKEYTFDLSRYYGKGRIAIVHHNVTDQFILNIDDVSYHYSNDGYTMLNSFLDNSTYTQVGQVVFNEPWKSIQVKLQEESAGSASGFFVIQNGGRLRFIMPAGYNNANLRFVIHNAPASSNYYHGTFTLASSTGATKTIPIPEGSDDYADRDYEAIFTGISTGDVITITGTHNHEGTLYHYSPDFKYIHVYVEGGTDGISENTPLNLAAIKFVDQFKAETREDKHPYRYGYVLRSVPNDPTQEVQESAKPEFPVQHTGASLNGFYTLTELQEDTLATLKMNVMNAEVNMNLTTNPQVYYYTLDRKPSTTPDAAYLEISKLQKREDDTYQEMDNILSDYEDIFDPEVTPRYDNYNVMTGDYNSYMSYVPVAWTHGDLSNRRIKWDAEKRHNSYGAPIWKTGVAKVDMVSAIAERQKGLATNWTYNNEECSLYMLDDVEAVATMPTANNVKYVPYMFRIFVKSKNHKLRGYTYVQADVDPNLPGSHFAGDVIDCDSLACVWSGYVNDPDNAKNGVTFNIDEENNTITFCKDKVDRTNPSTGVWDKSADQNAMFAALKDIIKDDQTTTIDENDLTIFVRFYYIVEGFNADKPAFMLNRGESPAGYGAESGSKSPSPMTAVNEISYKGEVVSQTYYNVQGMASDKPFSGVNIVIKRYSDGTTVTTKEVR